MELVLFAGSLYTFPLPTAFKIAHNVDVTAIEGIILHKFEYSIGEELFRETSKVMPVATLHAPFFDVNGWRNKIRGPFYPPAGPKNRLQDKCGIRFSQNDNFQIGFGLFARASTN